MSLLNIEALRSTPLKTEPFEYCVVPDFVTGEALERIQADFPDIEHGGSFPLDALTYGPAFDEMAQELLSPEVRDIFGEYFGIDLEGRPPTLTVRGRTRLKDGKIHLDSKTKLITVLIYFNPDWDSEGGRLRFLGSGNNIEDVIDEVLDQHIGEGNPDEWDFDALWAELKTLYPIGITIDEVVAEAGEKGRINREFVRSEILSDAQLAYGRREEQLGSPAMRELERRVVLSVIDRRWRDHLYEMDYLKDGIGLRAMAQRDPLVEYQREGYAMFQQMMGSIREESVGFLFNLEVEVNPAGAAGPTIAARGLTRNQAPEDKLSYSAPSDSGGVEVRNQRGQVQQAATQRARRAVAAQQAQATPRPSGQEVARGAFGQPTSGDQAPEQAPQNRAQRRAQERRGR